MRFDGEKYLLPRPPGFVEEEETGLINEQDIPIKYIEEPADEEQPEIRPTAEEIREEAKKEARDILEKAQKQAEEIRQKAEKESEVIYQEARKEAREKGYEEGLAGGKEEVLATWKDILQKAQGRFSELEQKADNWEKDFPAQVIDLSVEVARRIIGEELDREPEIIVSRVREALKEMAQVGEVLIKVCPRDYPLVEAAREKLAEENGGLKKISLMSTEELEKGDFLVETQFGGVDGRVKTQLELLSGELKKRWSKNGKN